MILIHSFLNSDYRLPGPGGEGWYQDLEVIGTGASCVVYRAVFADDSAGHPTTDHLLKEYNPALLHTERRSDGCLVPASYDHEAYNAGLQRFRNGYICQQKIRRMASLTNSTGNIQRTFDANGTAYIDMTVMNGQTYTQVEEPSLYQLLRRMKTLTEVIRNYHKAGYLHLDIKPDNIFVYPETPEMLLLFDFDSVVPKDSIAASTGLSYTKDWAAPEQQISSQRKWICEATDLYSVGEIIFTRIFGRHSELEDRRSFASFDYDLDSPFLRTVNPRLFPLLTELLHKTLCGMPEKRYRHAEELLGQLDKMIPLADPEKAFVRTNATYQSACFYGREELLSEIDAFFCERASDKGNALFLSGVGGIGKTELARRYACLHEKEYDRIIFLPFRNSMKDTLCQDVLKVYHGNQPESEINARNDPDGEYAYILGVLKEDLTPKDLLILDNFDTFDKQIKDVLSINCKILVTTRLDVADYDYPQRMVEAIGETDALWQIFRKYNQRDYSEEECAKIERLIDHVDRHTMTICLISKYLRDSRSAPSELLETLMTREGITATQESTHVKHRKDCCPNDESVQKHLRILFDLSHFSQNEIDFMAALSLLGSVRIKRERLQTLLGSLYREETLQSLAKTGWVEMSEENVISLHQIILDLAYNTLVPKCTSLEPAVEGMIKYARESSESEILKKTKCSLVKNFQERLSDYVDKMSGGRVLAAELCFCYYKLGGDEAALDKAEQLCGAFSTRESYDLQFQIELERIGNATAEYEVVEFNDPEQDYIEHLQSSILAHEMKAWKFIFSPTEETPQKCQDVADYIGRLSAPDASVCSEGDAEKLEAFLERVPLLLEPINVRTDQIEKLIDLAQEMDSAGDSFCGWEFELTEEDRAYIFYRDEECTLRYAYLLAVAARQDNDLQEKISKELADFYSDEGYMKIPRSSCFGDVGKKAFYTMEVLHFRQSREPQPSAPDMRIITGYPDLSHVDSYLDAADDEEEKENYKKAIELLMRAMDAHEAPEETIVLRLAWDYIQLYRSEEMLQDAYDSLLDCRAYEQQHGISDNHTLLTLADVCGQMGRAQEQLDWYNTLIQAHHTSYETLDEDDRAGLLFSYCRRAELDERYPIDDILGRWMAERLTEFDVSGGLNPRLSLVYQKLFDPLQKLVGFQDAIRLLINAADKFSFGKESEAEALYFLVCEQCRLKNREWDFCFSVALKAVTQCAEMPLPNRSYFLTLLEELSPKTDLISELNIERYHYFLSEQAIFHGEGDIENGKSLRKKCNFYLIAEYDAEACDSVDDAVTIWNRASSDYEGVCDYANALRCCDRIEKLIVSAGDDFMKIYSLGYCYENQLRMEHKQNDLEAMHACIEKMHRLWCCLAVQEDADEQQITSLMRSAINELASTQDAIPTVLLGLICIHRMISGKKFHLPADLLIFDEQAARAQITQLLSTPLEAHSDACLDEVQETMDVIDSLYRSAFPENTAAWEKFQKACSFCEIEKKHEQ